MRRFLPWEDTIILSGSNKEPVEESVKEAKINVARIQYKLSERNEILIECKTI